MEASNFLDLKGQSAIVTGGGRGLGKAIALELAKAGANVVVAARSAEEINQVVDEIKSMGAKGLAVPTNVTSETEVKGLIDAAIASFGGVDILVNNAGISRLKPFIEYSLDDWQRVMNANLTSAFLCCREAGPQMIRQNRGKIINIASIAGLRGSPGGLISYNTSKGALISFTRALAVEWAKYNINVNAIAPGRFNTAMNAGLLANPERKKQALDRIPLHRVGEPPEVAYLTVYLASAAADFITGEVINIDGGAMVG